MNNQAAQTMPVIDDFNGDNAKLIESARALISLSDSGSLAHHGIGGHARAILSAFIVRTEAAALSQTAGVPEGWMLAHRQTLEIVGEELARARDKVKPAERAWLADLNRVVRGMLAAAPAASGGESPPDALPDGTLSKSTAKRVEALASASVSERARALMAQAYRDGGFPHAAGTLEAGVIDSVDSCALRAIEQALTQQRGDDVESAARALFEAQADPLAASWDRQWGPTKELWRKVARGNLYATTPQPSADAVRELVEALQVAELALRERGLRACGEYKQIAAAIAKASNHQQNAAQGGGEK